MRAFILFGFSVWALVLVAVWIVRDVMSLTLRRLICGWLGSPPAVDAPGGRRLSGWVLRWGGWRSNSLLPGTLRKIRLAFARLPTHPINSRSGRPLFLPFSTRR